MVFKIENLATIRMSVSDVEKSRDWYRTFLGIEPVEDSSNFASFRIGNALLDIALADEKSPVSKGGSVGYWLVDNLDAAIEKAKSLNGKIYRGPLRVDEVHKTIVQIEDAQGNVFGLEAEF